MRTDKKTTTQDHSDGPVTGDKNRLLADLKSLGTVGPAAALSPFQFKVPWFNSRTTSFKPERDIPDLSGKVILVTGGNAGIGKQAVLDFAKHKPAKIYLAARSAEKAEKAIQEVKNAVPDVSVTHLPLDLSSLESVKKAAKIVNSTTPRLDILMLNAGVMALPWSTSTEGYEMQLATNHIGHAALTKLLLPLLLKTAEEGWDVRVVLLSSLGHRMAPAGGLTLDIEAQKKLDPWARYGVSKLANALFAKELARRYPQLKTAAVHPGIGVTDLYNPSGASNPIMAVSMKLSTAFLATPKQLALNQLWAATSDKVESGQYYDPVGQKCGASPQATDEKLAGTLWEWTEAELAKHGFS